MSETIRDKYQQTSLLEWHNDVCRMISHGAAAVGVNGQEEKQRNLQRRDDEQQPGRPHRKRADFQKFKICQGVQQGIAAAQSAGGKQYPQIRSQTAADQHIEKGRQEGGGDGQTGGYRGVFAGCGEKEHETDTGEQCYKTAQHDKILHLPYIQVKQADYREQDLHGGLPAFPAEQTVGNQLEDDHAGNKGSDPDAQGSEDLDQGKPPAAVSGAAQNIVCAGLVFTAKKRRGDHHAKEHEQEEAEPFVFGHIAAVAGIVVKRRSDLFIHLYRCLLCRRIVFLFQLHQVGNVAPAAVIECQCVVGGDVRIFRRHAAYRIGHGFSESHHQRPPGIDFLYSEV